ncbi:uncharacterized protein SOCE836_052930 [Sorangium cellulosum]|uniref:Uncharacterized protein n=1 Tax=Sorangium cellulosum TaxID=56 RepID=A0A4P2QS92_SORCE|nr:hypothetical protein [Sorangium cellulosum]AUX33139.1 uncharacterized protein SOCE836_052930 [Sorangium cellulosum]
MRSIIAALVVGVAMAVGCKAIPDGDDLDRLQDQVASLPTGLKAALSQWAANRIAYGYCLNHRGNNLGGLFCVDGKAKDGEYIPVPMEEMLLCLNRNLTTTYKECLDLIVRDINRIRGDQFGCEWSWFEPDMDPAKIPPEMDAKRITDEQIRDALLGPPPPSRSSCC